MNKRPNLFGCGQRAQQSPTWSNEESVHEDEVRGSLRARHQRLPPEESLKVAVDAESRMIQRGLREMASDRIFTGVKMRAIKRRGCHSPSPKPFS